MGGVDDGDSSLCTERDVFDILEKDLFILILKAILVMCLILKEHKSKDLTKSQGKTLEMFKNVKKKILAAISEIKFLKKKNQIFVLVREIPHVTNVTKQHF